eukprot:TRINITY_DN5886_c0_g1_i1.p1 TRINITY_DN5886_c0_g1~~TRINITY_DN5886_c0_g1_i1.p1  ORF type:complete len:530 (-),score=143.98 TRINITY_DN5886_c0_g1_i1:1026-2615(-)
MEYESPSQSPTLTQDQRLKLLYPMVNEEETPLPRCWSTKDKYNYIGLSQSNLRVHYKGHGKTHKDASSVRATHPIPASCGLYYFEVKIISKGRDGYMGVGLSAQGVNMNRLPGWDKHSYGYHGDDGHSFCSSGTGQAYGPTFTTGDVIGCGINLIDGSCFYTKNGHHLGIAFQDLPSGLYPTVGLQTPGEVIDANFGQEPFKFDIEGEMRELRRKTQGVIEDLSWPRKHGDAQAVLHNMVSTYLVHHGYSQTAESFARSAGQEISEELTSMRNRQHIQKLVLAGKLGEAISTVDQLYPGLLALNQDLHFRLKVRQFIEMVSGADSLEIESESGGGKSWADTSSSSGHSGSNMDMEEQVDNAGGDVGNHENHQTEQAVNGNSQNTSNGNVDCEHSTDNMDVDAAGPRANSILANPARFECLIRFGRSLHVFASQMEQEKGRSEANSSMLQEAFSLLAYADPWDSPVGGQLDPAGREPVCAQLNSAILESKNLPGRPPLEISLAHSAHLLKLMSNSELGACAFADIQSILN